MTAPTMMPGMMTALPVNGSPLAVGLAASASPATVTVAVTTCVLPSGAKPVPVRTLAPMVCSVTLMDNDALGTAAATTDALRAKAAVLMCIEVREPSALEVPAVTVAYTALLTE